MKKSNSFVEIPENQQTQEDKVFELSTGITTRLLKKYKPSQNAIPIGINNQNIEYRKAI